MAEVRRRVPDRVLWIGLALSLALLVAVALVAVLSHLNPAVPPLALPTASSR